MSDHESMSEANGTYSTNGTDPGGIAVAGGDEADGNAFLADLARAMQTTAAAEQARNAEGTEQRRQAHIDAIRAREALEAEDLRELAKEDVKGIDAWSDGEIKRIKLERERRIAARREQLQVRLEEHRSVVSREVDAVEAAIASYRADIELYFRRLESETDPVAIATLARSRPQFPVLDSIGPDDAMAASVHQVPAGISSTEVPVDQIATSEPASEAPVAEPSVAEVAVAEAPMTEAAVDPEPVSSHDDQPPSASADETAADSPLVGVMDQDAASASPGTTWEAGPDAVAAEATEGSPEAATETTTEVTTPEETTPEETTPVNEGSDATEAPEGSPEAEPEPVGAVAESRVVMPRSTGTGSWLRWPNSTADRSDQPR